MASEGVGVSLHSFSNEQEVSVLYESRSSKVKFYSEMSTSSIKKAIIGMFDISGTEDNLLLQTERGESLKDGKLLNVPKVIRVIEIKNQSPFQSLIGKSPSFESLIGIDLPQDRSFQTQFVKFERVLSHLANERTWLAWVRAALTLLGNAFVLWKLRTELSHKTHPIIKDTVTVLGISFVLVVPITAFIGWIRYERTKMILGLSSFALKDQFGTIGVTIQASLLGLVLLLTAACYWCLGDYYIFGNWNKW